jgi:hypothetical protein
VTGGSNPLEPTSLPPPVQPIPALPPLAAGLLASLLAWAALRATAGARSVRPTDRAL